MSPETEGAVGGLGCQGERCFSHLAPRGVAENAHEAAGGPGCRVDPREEDSEPRGSWQAQMTLGGLWASSDRVWEGWGHLKAQEASVDIWVALNTVGRV